MNNTKIIAMMSCPRLGYNDFYGHSQASFQALNIPFKLLYGVFWCQALEGGFRQAIEDGYDYIITTDFDSIYDHATVMKLIELAQENPEADAICAMQMGRFSGLLVSNDKGHVTHKELMNDLLPVDTGHFGLTIIKVDALKKLSKPWFLMVPNSEGTYEGQTDKTDPDIYFWKHFAGEGLKLFVAPRLIIGHMELCIKWPDFELNPLYQTVHNYNETNCPPPEIWR